MLWMSAGLMIATCLLLAFFPRWLRSYNDETERQWNAAIKGTTMEHDPRFQWAPRR